jgi:hypothetical protein
MTGRVPLALFDLLERAALRVIELRHRQRRLRRHLRAEHRAERTWPLVYSSPEHQSPSREPAERHR